MSPPDVTMRRLLTVIHYPVFGGPHNHVVRLNRPLEERRWKTVTLLPEEPGNSADRLREAGVEVVQIPLHRLRGKADPMLQARYLLNVTRDTGRIRRIIREQRIDLVRIIGLLNPQAAIAGRLEGVPVVWQIGDSWPPGLVRHAYMRLVNRLADTVLFNGRRLLELHGGEAALRIPWAVYYPPVDTGRFKPDAVQGVETRRLLGIPPEARVVGVVANLNPHKGIEYFIRAASLIHRRFPDNWYLIVGERYDTHREYWARLQAEVDASAVPRERMLFTGGTDSPERYYPAMDVKLITSVPRSEGTTTTAIEAMACGVPVVASDVGAISDVVNHGVTGVLVAPVDAEASAAAVLKLMDDPLRRSRMGEAAREAAVEKFGVAACANAIDHGLNSAVVTHESRRSKHALQ